MKPKLFFFLLLLITVLGLILRLNKYDQIPPFGETRDEFQYPWAGMSLIQNGVPTSWSYFDAYQNRQSIWLWDQEFRLVTPWFDKPVLYPLLTGSWILANGIKQFDQVNLATLRLLPIFLSCLTIFLTGLLAKKIFNPTIGLLSALLYATTPTIVLANRLSLSENLLTPIVLFILIIYFISQRVARVGGPPQKGSPFEDFLWGKTRGRTRWLMIGLGCGLAFLTKQIGISLYLTVALLLFYKRQWQQLFIMSIIFGFFVLLHLALVFTWDFKLYLAVMQDFRIAHTLSGLPELVMSIFRYPGISEKTRPFLDGTILAGFLLLFTSPWWLQVDYDELMGDAGACLPARQGQGSRKRASASWQIALAERETRGRTHEGFYLLIFPFAYLTLLTIVENASQPYTYFGWHIYPLFPFIIILLGKILYDLWQAPDLLKIISLILILGSSSIRFIFLTLPRQFQYHWQYVMIGLLGMILVIWLSHRLKWQKLVLWGLFLAYLISNIWTDLNLIRIYQP